MNNKQDYYYALFWRSLLVVYIFVYVISGYRHLDLLYNKQVSLFVSPDNNLVGMFANILNYVPGSYVWVVWTSLLLVAPFILYRKTHVVASLFLWYIFSCFLRISPLSGNIGTQTILMVLIFSAFVAIPNKRTDMVSNDKEGGAMPEKSLYTHQLLYLGLWITFCVYYFYSGYTKITSYAWQIGQALVSFENNPLMRGGVILEIYTRIPSYVKIFFTYFVSFGELLTPLALIGISLRKIVWSVTLVIQLGLLVCMNFSDIQMIMLIFSFVVFDPAWIPSDKKYHGVATLYYDGYCALCHHFVKHVINIDHQDKIIFKVIEGTPYQKKGKQPESFVVVHDGVVMQKVDALIFVYRVTGGMFRVIAFLISCVPRFLSNYVYDMVAKNRYVLFGKKPNTCPVIDEELSKKFR